MNSLIWKAAISLLVVLVTEVYGQRRLQYVLNEGCRLASGCDTIWAAHILSQAEPGAAVGPDYHYLWVFGHGYKPSVLMFEADSGAKLTIDWASLLHHSPDNYIRFEPDGAVRAAFGFELSRLFLRTTDQQHSGRVKDIALEQLQWKVHNVSESQNSVVVSFRGSDLHIGSFQFTLTAPTRPGTMEQLPHLAFTGSSNVFNTLIETVHLGNLSKDIEACANITILMSPIHQPTHLFTSRTSNDDEYTPGVFCRFTSELEGSDKDGNGTHQHHSYLAWKPVTYYDNSHAISKSLKVPEPRTEPYDKLPPTSLIHGYFNGIPVIGNSIQLCLNSVKEDVDFKFNSNPNLEFSLVLGLGTPPSEKISITLLTVLAFGFGLPLLLFIASVIYTVYRGIKVNLIGTNYDRLGNVAATD